MNKPIIVSLALAISTAACGTGEDAQTATEGTVSVSDAQISVQQVAKLSGMLSSTDNALVAFLAMGSANQGIVIPRSEPYEPRGLFPHVPVTTALNIGTMQCMAGSCTFTHYGYSEGPYTNYTIDGTITHSGDTSTFDLTSSFKDYYEYMDWVISGSVTTTATRVDGTIHSHGAGHAAHGSSPLPTWDVTVDYAAITLDAQGCPTGGTVHAVTSYVHAADADPFLDGETPSFAVKGTVALGAACN